MFANECLDVCKREGKRMRDMREQFDDRETEFELTKEGWLLCAGAGLMEELTVFVCLKITLWMTPLSVFLVLWAAFGMMSAALLFAIAFWRERSVAAQAKYRTAETLVHGRWQQSESEMVSAGVRRAS